METPFTAYVGDEAFVFVCYAHEDSKLVYPEMTWLRDQGVNVWYDEGISAGKNWRTAIGDSLLSASHVLFYVSAASLKSDHCNREINLALDEGKDVVPVYIDDVELTTDLKVGLNRVQALHRDEDASYQQHLLQALGHAADRFNQAATNNPVKPGFRFSVFIGAALAVVLLAGTGWWYWTQQQNSTENSTAQVATAPPSIAIMPFVNMSSDPDQEYFSDGISEEILSLLAQNPAIRVISRSSAFSFKGTNTGMQVIAEKLQVDHVLEGSVRRFGDKVRVSVQLIDASSDVFLWSDTYDRKLDDIFAVQSDIAGNVARAMNVALIDPVPISPAASSESYLLYSQGRHLLGLGTAEDAARALVLLELAVEQDPAFVRGWTELARAYGRGRGREENAEQLAEEATERALTLNPDDAVANAWRGWQSIMYNQQFETGVRFYNKSLAMDPTNIDILRGLENVLQLLDRPEVALQTAKYVADRDPLCGICLRNLANAFRSTGQINKSDAMYHRSLTLNPDDLGATTNLAINRIIEGDGASAFVWIDQLPEDWVVTAVLRAIAAHESGRLDERNLTLSGLEEKGGDTGSLAMVYAWIGESDRAFALLVPIVEEHPAGLPTPRSPLWRKLHSDPRWQGLLEKSGLSPARLANLNLQVDVAGNVL